MEMQMQIQFKRKGARESERKVAEVKKPTVSKILDVAKDFTSKRDLHIKYD